MNSITIHAPFVVLFGALFLNLTTPALSVDTRTVSFDSIEYKTAAGAVSIKIDHKGALTDLSLTYHQRVMTVPKSEFVGLAEVDLRACRILTTAQTEKKGFPDLETGYPDYIIVYLEYGPATEMKPHGSADQHSRVFFLFSSEDYDHRERLVPVKQTKKWKILIKGPGEAEDSSGIVKKPHPHDPPCVPVRN